MKKIISALLALVFLCGFFVPAFAESGRCALRFNSDGKFRIMIFADIHEGGTGGGEACLQIMREALDKYQPELAVFLGDNSISDTLDGHREIIEKITEPVRERNIPYAAIFGNHDSQAEDVTKEELLEIYREYGCLSYDGGDDIYGCANFNLPVLSSSCDEVKFNLFFFDSGSDNPDEEEGGYDYIREDQINYYKETALSLKAANAGKTVPAVAFQHIPVPEIYDKIFTQVPYALGKATLNGYNGKAYSIIPRFTGYEGILFENVASPYRKTKQLETMRQVGDVMAVFSGHDHVNSYTVDLDGIDWVSVPTPHNKNYSNDCVRGVGLITIDENDNTKYEYELIQASRLCMEKDSKICDMSDSTSKFGYFVSSLFADALLAVQKLMNRSNGLFVFDLGNAC